MATGRWTLQRAVDAMIAPDLLDHDVSDGVAYY
ncbi:hypothetical protein HDE77_003557 [Rhodanobacter sp. MP7CTX1]|nr:hypothetical protein [Rhodanobacter sp. MP7CTX1]